MTAPTYGDLKRLVADTPRGDWPSRVNPALTRSQALGIFDAALRAHRDDELCGTTRGALLALNIIRECLSRADAEGHDEAHPAASSKECTTDANHQE